MTLLKKALIAFAVLAVLTAGGELLVIRKAGSSADMVRDFEARAATFQRAVLGMKNDFYLYDDQNNMYVLVAATSPSNQQLVEDTYAQGVKGLHDFGTDLALAETVAPQTARDILTRIGEDMKVYEGFATQTRTLQQAGDVQGAAIAITVSNADASNQLMVDIDEAQQAADDMASASLQSISDGQSVVESLATGVGLLVVLLLVLLAVAFLRSVIRPMRGLRGRMYDIAEGDGDLTARVDESRRDEFGDLARAFNLFVGRIQRVMRTFSESAAALMSASKALEAITLSTGSAADDTSQQAGAVSEAAGRVADHVNSVAAGADEMGGSISEIAQSASNAALVADEARRQAAEIETRIRVLSNASSEIGTVVALISGIAEQTNLLALNATIEAARAGEAGRGFAVVAGEVKDLAAATARATTDITAQVARIQSETGHTVTGISEIVAVIQQVSDLQGTIAAAVEEQSASTSVIARSAADAASGAGAIRANIDEVAHAVDGTSSGVKSSKETIAELAQLSASLSGLIGEFRI